MHKGGGSRNNKVSINIKVAREGLSLMLRMQGDSIKFNVLTSLFFNQNIESNYDKGNCTFRKVYCSLLCLFTRYQVSETETQGSQNILQKSYCINITIMLLF